MSSLDGIQLFGSGPHCIRPGAWERQLMRRSFAGLDGELVLDMGLRSRLIGQEGRLQADSAGALNALIDAVHSFVDARPHTLADNHGLTYPRVVVEHFEPATPLRRGRGFWCDYSIRYRQLP